ncbi:hypothetical protein [Pedobacter sp.]|uniref:hypothetical protein n=1 Tax=Pedobacter sp. TaxID=1411316 RepID=UPI003D7F202B
MMDITLKYKIVEKIIQSNDENLLNEINSLLSLTEADFWTETPTEAKQAIHAAKEELDRGEGISHAEVMNEVKNLFSGRS